MKPVDFAPHVYRPPPEPRFYVNPWMMRDRYVAAAPYGTGIVGGTAVVSEIVTRRFSNTEKTGPTVVSQTTEDKPGRRVIVTTERQEIVTTEVLLFDMVQSVPVGVGAVSAVATGGGEARASAAEGQRVIA